MLMLLAVLALAPSPTPASESEPCVIRVVATVDGKPAAGTTLHLLREMDWQLLDQKSAVPDKDGRFTFGGLLPGWYRLSAFHEDAMPQAAGSWYCPGFGKRRDVALVMKRGGELVEGSVTDLSGAALAGASASVNNAGTPKTIDGSAVIPVDKQGRFKVRLTEGANYNLFAKAPAHRFESFSMNLARGHTPIGARDLKLARQPRIKGVVIDGKGKPIAGASVFRGPITSNNPPDVVTSDKAGKFELEGTIEADLVVMVQAGKLTGSARIGKMSQETDVTGVRVTASPGRTLRGVVVRPTGEAHPRGEVFYRATNGGAFGRVRADAKGRFVIEGLPLADVEVRALSGEPHWQLVRQGTDDVEVELVPLGEQPSTRTRTAPISSEPRKREPLDRELDRELELDD